MDAVQQANSGHPGMPMGMADIATVLYKDHLKFDPNDPRWLDRDRLIISNGHGSMLLYAALYLTGYKDISLKDLKKLRYITAHVSGGIKMLKAVKENAKKINNSKLNFSHLFSNHNLERDTQNRKFNSITRYSVKMTNVLIKNLGSGIKKI